MNVLRDIEKYTNKLCQLSMDSDNIDILINELKESLDNQFDNLSQNIVNAFDEHHIQLLNEEYNISYKFISGQITLLESVKCEIFKNKNFKTQNLNY